MTDRIAPVVETYTDRGAAQNRKVRVLAHVLRFDDLLVDEAAAFVVADDKDPVRLSDEGGTAHARVELSDPSGHQVTQGAEGEGPVEALFAALSHATGVGFVLETYEVHSMGMGADARGEANLSARIDGELVTGQGTSRDVLQASAIAWLDVANRVLRERQPLREAVVA